MGPLGSPGPTTRAEIHLSLVLTETFWQKLGPADQKCSQETDKELVTALFIIATKTGLINRKRLYVFIQ